MPETWPERVWMHRRYPNQAPTSVLKIDRRDAQDEYEAYAPVSELEAVKAELAYAEQQRGAGIQAQEEARAENKRLRGALEHAVHELEREKWHDVLPIVRAALNPEKPRRRVERGNCGTCRNTPGQICDLCGNGLNPEKPEES